MGHSDAEKSIWLFLKFPQVQLNRNHRTVLKKIVPGTLSWLLLRNVTDDHSIAHINYVGPNQVSNLIRSL